MFIKKDLRKIPKILEDAIVVVVAEDDDENTVPNNNNNNNNNMNRDSKRPKVQKPLEELRLARRQQEFQGTLKILCQPQYLPKLTQLQNLNLYDCAISNVDDISLLANCPLLEHLNLGRNPLTTLPDALGQVKSLKQIWLDDCQLTGCLPKCLTQLPNLTHLRLPNNHIDELPFPAMTQLTKLEVLNVDRNQLTHMIVDDKEDGMSNMPSLKELYVRHNMLRELPPLPASLMILHASSNQLTHVNWMGSNGMCPNLTQVFLNGNRITSLPPGIVTNHPHLTRLLISHNPLNNVPDEFWNAKSCDIVWKPNPELERQQQEQEQALALQETTEESMAMAMEY